MITKKFKRTIITAMVCAFTFSSFQFTKVLAIDNLEKETLLETSETQDLNRKIVGYFPEWAYKSEAQGYFNVTDLQWNELTHIQYSFAMIDPATNKIKLGDEFAATVEDFSSLTQEQLTYNDKVIEIDESLPYKGHFNHLQSFKKEYPDVQLLISVGGWAGSRGFYTMLDTDEGIETFAESCVEFIREYGFDGVDIDFEYPSATSQSGNPDDFDLSEPRRDTINERYNLMMKTLREKIDQAGKEDKKDYLLTAAVTASSWVLGGVSDNSYAESLDFLSVMSYDFHGGWNEYVENLANIYSDSADRETAQMLMPVLSMDWAYRYYRGVLPPEKILMGIPYYSRGWENVQGGDGTGLHGSSKTPASGKYNVWGDDLNGDGVLEPAGANPLWHILNLIEEDENFNLYWDDIGKVPHAWQDEEKVFLSFENEQSIEERLKYIEEKNLGGALIWVMNGDYGLNENYVPGSSNINEGKYTYGNTLTKKLSDGLKEMGQCDVTDDSTSTNGDINVDVSLSGKYDHPNYTYSLNVTNHTTEDIAGGWTIEFNLPYSAIFKTAWGGTVTQTPNGDFTKISIVSPTWTTLKPGETQTLEGMIGLCFSGVRNITFNNMNPIGNKPSESPTITGVENSSVKIGSSFNPLDGVSATDYIDGDLTDLIMVTGNVDTDTLGSYPLTYSVTNSRNLTTTVTRIITIQNEETIPTENFDINKIYVTGDIVLYNGKLYRCKWWTQGVYPDQTSAFELIQ
ncbi:MAG: glycosyl hydrolase family 18 protein [Sarcina sp.]